MNTYRDRRPVQNYDPRKTSEYAVLYVNE